MLIDNLGLLRADGSSPRVATTEAGSILLTKDSTTGKRVIDISKTGLRGIPIVVVTDDDTGDCCTGTDWLIVTIEASDTLIFTSKEVVATFPKLTTGANGTLMVRRVHTQKKYLRSVITESGSGVFGIDFLIFIGTGLMNT